VGDRLVINRRHSGYVLKHTSGGGSKGKLEAILGHILDA